MLRAGLLDQDATAGRLMIGSSPIDGVDGSCSQRRDAPMWGHRQTRTAEKSMKEITTIGLDLAKNVFQLHAIKKDGTVAVRRQLRRSQVLPFFERLPTCLVGMEAGAGSHHWARELMALGHDVRLMPPSYVKPYVKRQKNDAADAEAICEAVTRPTMRFTPAKTEAQQAAILLHRTREFLVRQRTQIANVLRAYAAEFGVVVATGVQNVPRLLACIEDDERLPNAVRLPMRLLAGQFHALEASIAEVTGAISEAHKADETSRRLATIPGVGLLTASLVSATTPDVTNFRSARDYAAWLGLTPKQRSSGGKERVGRLSKMGNRSIRRLLYLGALARIRIQGRSGAADPWLAGMLARKPVKLVAIALANRMARVIWALLRTGEVYRSPA
jgi:transposase